MLLCALLYFLFHEISHTRAHTHIYLSRFVDEFRSNPRELWPVPARGRNLIRQYVNEGRIRFVLLPDPFEHKLPAEVAAR